MKVRYLGDGVSTVWTGQVVSTNAILRFAVRTVGPAKLRDVLDVEECVWDVDRKLVVCARITQWPDATVTRKRKALV